MPIAIVPPHKKKPALPSAQQKKAPPPSRGPKGSSPIPLAAFMPPPTPVKRVGVATRASTGSGGVAAKKKVPFKPPTKVAAAKDIESAARALLKLSRQLKA